MRSLHIVNAKPVRHCKKKSITVMAALGSEVPLMMIPADFSFSTSSVGGSVGTEY